MTNILKRLGAFRNKAITHIVDTEAGPTEFKFYPPRMRMMISGQMRTIIDPISRAMGVIFSNKGQDVSRQQEVSEDGLVTTFVQGLNPAVIEIRERKRSEAIGDALGVLLNDDTRYHIGALLADSMRDDFSENEAERAKEVRVFMDEIDLPTMIELLKGYFKALAPVLDKSGNSILSNLQKSVKREVSRALNGTEEGEVTADGLINAVTPKDVGMMNEQTPNVESETTEPQS
tara:strand:- start:873 stop:1568 length:696 start_codon:yes stop_codon:yes gene_type:complete